MEKKAFLKLCANLFEANGFVRKGNTFYLENECGILLAFGLQKSSYDAYYYMEHGIAFKEINKYLPYPKINELDINMGRIMTRFGKALWYESLDEQSFCEISNAVQNKLDVLYPIINAGKEEILKQILCPNPIKISYIFDGVAQYLGIDIEHLRTHHISIVTE